MKNVTIYSTENCTYCAAAKDFMKAHNVSYTEHNVGTDVEKRKEMIEISGQMGVPVIHVGDEVLVGFDEARLASMLEVK